MRHDGLSAPLATMNRRALAAGQPCDQLCDAGGAMHVDVVNSVVINRPAAEVSQYAAAPDNAPLFLAREKELGSPVRSASRVLIA